MLVLSAVALVWAAAAAGCGGEELTKEQYVDATAAPLGTIDAALLGLETASSADLRAEAARAEAALLGASAALDEIDAPEELREAHDLLVDGVRELANGLDGVLTGPAGDVAGAVQRIMALPALEKLGRARERFAQEDVTLEFGEPPSAGP